MKTCVMLLSVLSLVLSDAHGVVAVGKITVDPNSPSTQAEAQPKQDGRLAKNVTYQARHRAVKAILADISDTTGVALRAGYNEKDWQVRDRKMNVFVKDIPLGTLMSSIARVMKFKWSVNHDADPWTYRLYMDRDTLLGADAKLYRAQEAFDKEITQRRKSVFELIMNMKDLSASELNQLRQDNPYLYLLQTRGAGRAYQALFREIPGLVDAFINRDKNFSVPMSSLSAGTQQLVMNAIKMKWPLKGYAWAGNGQPFPQDIEDNASAGRVIFDIKPREFDWDDMTQQWYFGGMGAYFGDRFVNVAGNLCEPSSDLIKYSAECELQAYDTDAPLSEIRKQTESEYKHLEVKEADLMQAIVAPDPKIEHPDEPALHAKIKMRVDGKEFVDYEAALADASGLAIVSDSFNVTRGIASVKDSETALKDILEAIADGYRYNWEKHGFVIELSSKDWFRNRSSQIPDEWIDVWHANMKQLGYLKLDDLAEIATLTNLQIEENIRGDEVFQLAGVINGGFLAARPVLRFCSSLSRTQRTAMLGSGLTVQSLQPDQWELLRSAYKNSSVESGEIQAMIKGASLSKHQQRVECAVSVVNVADGTSLHKWKIALPIYREPPKPQPLAQDSGKGRVQSQTPTSPASAK